MANDEGAGTNLWRQRFVVGDSAEPNEVVGWHEAIDVLCAGRIGQEPRIDDFGLPRCNQSGSLHSCAFEDSAIGDAQRAHGRERRGFRGPHVK